MVIVLFGVAGSGKTTVGLTLAKELAWEFHDGDDFHSPASIHKMRRGIPLDDEDRWPWLDAIRAVIAKTVAENTNAVIACSALSRAHRSYLDQPGVRFVFLKAPQALLRERLGARRGHFFDPGLLASQLDALQEPPDTVLSVDAAQSLPAVVRAIRAGLDLAR